MNDIPENSRDGLNNLTSIYMDLATSRMLTVDEAIESLMHESYLRTVWETVRRYSGLEDMDDAMLKTALLDMLAQGSPQVNRDSIRRKISTWADPSKYEIKRSSALELAFALGLSPNDAEEMMYRLCGEGFHWRDPKDIVYIYGLNNGLKFSQANALLERMSARGLLPEAEKKATKGKAEPLADEQSDQKLVQANVEKAREEMTWLVTKDVGLLQSEEELEAFLEDARDRLGEMHNTAYTLFIDYMNLLRQPTPMEDKAPGKKRKGDKPQQDAAMSVEEILQTYMFDRYIPKHKGAPAEIVQSALQRAIQSYWPNPATLSKMRTRKVDVTRKVMILLFLACDGGESPYGDQTEETLDDTFQDMYIRLDSMLLDCGYAPLDARSPFDWMVLYCMCSDDSFVIDDRMKCFLQRLFTVSGTKEDSGEDGDEDE